MRTKIDKDVKKKDVVVQPEPGDQEKKQSKPKKVKKAKKVENSESAIVVQESTECVTEAPPADLPEPPPVCNEFPDEVEAAVNSITEPCERTSLEVLESVSEQVVIENHVEFAETETGSKSDPEPAPDLVLELVTEQTPDPVPDASDLPVDGNAEEEIIPERLPNPKDVPESVITPSESELQPEAVAEPEAVKVPEESEAGTKTVEPEKKPVPDYSSYDSIIDKVACGDIIVTTPPRKPPKKRRNDECKSKEKLDFSEKGKKGEEKKKSDKKAEKKKADNSKKKDSPVPKPPEEKVESSKTDTPVSLDAGAKNRSKRTPKKRKFHDEQDDEQKPKVTKKASPKPKVEAIESNPSETPAQTSSSEKPKKSKKKSVKSKEQKEEAGEEKKDGDQVVKPKKVKKEKSAKKSKKVTPKNQEETADAIVPEVSPQTTETAQCSSDSGIGGTDSEMKIGSVEPSGEDGTSPSGENGLPIKMETDTSDQKAAEQPKKKSKSSKPKKPKETKEKVNGLPDETGVVVKEEEAPKPKKKSKAKKRKSEDGEKPDGSKSDEQKAEGNGEGADGTPASGEASDKPSPKKKKKKLVENGEGEVKKVKKKKKVKAPPPSEEGKENGKVSSYAANEAGVSAENGVGEGEGEGEGSLLDTSKEGSAEEENENNGENKVGSKFKLEKKVLETRECSLCGHKTRGLAALTRHMKRIHQIITKPPKFKCDRCDFDAAKRAVYAKHMLLHNVIMCFKCPYECSTSDALEEHVVEEHKNKGDLKLCRLCNRYVRCPENEDTLERHMEECKGKVPLICTECFKEFKYESGLKIHISTHFPDQPKLYTCELCSYQSNYKANLHKHIQNIHQEREKTIKCPECDKMFYKDEHMKRHLRLHTENRPYSCEKCEKTFKSLCSMRNHMESHNPGRPFKCEFEGCKKSFRTAKFLKNHVEEAHQLGEKRYHCSTQGCKFSFFKKSHLKRHEITHTGERNFHCMWPDCGKSFRHADNLKVHQRQHTNEKPIKCTQCSFSCRQRNSLQWHIKKHHTNKDGGLTVSQQGSPSGAAENDSEPKVNGVATPGASSDQCASVKSESKGLDLYEFNDEDFGEELPVVFRSRDKPRFHVLTRQDLDELHEAEKSKPIIDPLPETSKEGEEEGEKEEKEKEKEKEGEEKKEEKKSIKTPKKKKKKVIANKKSPPVKPVKKVKSPKSLKAPKSPKTPSSPRTPKSPKSQGTKKKGSPETSKKPEGSKKPETSKKKTVASKKKVSPQGKSAAASKKKSPAKKKETKSKAKSAGKKGKTKKAAKEDKKKEEVKEEEKEKEEEEKQLEEAAPEEAAAASPAKLEVSEEAPAQSPKPLVKPQSPGSDGSSLSPHSPHSERSEASPLLSENEAEEPAQSDTKAEEKAVECEDTLQVEEPPQEPFQEPEVPELPKEEAMSPGQAQQEAIDRSLEENPIIDDNLKDNHSQPDLRQYSPVGGEEEKTEEQQIEDEEQRVSSDDDVTNDILLTPPRAPAPPPPQSPSEEEEEEEEELMQPSVPSPAPVSVPVQEPLSHPEPMSNQPLSQDPQQPLPSVEPPKEEAQPPQPPAPQSAQYQNTNPECEKDYLGQYLHLQELGVPASGARDSVPEEPNRLQRLEELAEKPHEDSREIPRSASVASNVITHTSMQPFHDMSHKRMEILACDRSQEQHFQRDTASALPRLPDPPPFDSFNPLNSIHSVSRENNFLRQNDNIFTSQTTGSSFMRLSDSEAMRQRMTTPFLPQNDRTAISRLPDTTLRPTNPALLRRPTTMPSTDIFPPPPMTQTMPRNPFTNTWSGQDVRPPHWPQAPYLQRTIDRQPNATPATLFAKENYLASRDLMFDPSRMTERNMFTSLSSPQPQRELAPETFPLELSYFGSHAYSGTATLDYSRPPCGTAPKAFDERYRQTASSAMSDFRGFPQTSSTEMFSGIGVNSSFPLDKYMYTRDPVYHPQHVGENTNSAFLTHSTPTQHSVFDREYPHRSLYPHQNTPYPFLEERQYSTAAKLTHSAGSTTNQEQEFMSRRNTADSQIPPDPYRCGMLYNVMNRYSFE